MNKQDAIKVAAKYFPNYPSVNEFHVTKDEQIFEDAKMAGSHARSLVKQGEEAVVFAVTRAETKIEKVPAPKKENETGKNTKPVDERTPEQKEKDEKLKVAGIELKAAEKEVNGRQHAFDNAKLPEKKSAAETALNGAKERLKKAQEAYEALKPA